MSENINATETTVSPDQRSTQAVEAVRPLNTTQTRALSKLVANDAAQVASEIDQFANEQIAEAEARIKAEWAARSADSESWERRAAAITSRYNTSRRRLIREAEEAGVTLSIPRLRSGYHDDINATVNGLQQEVTEATREINKARGAALSNLNRQRLVLERRVLEASITPQAQTILDALPSAKDLMVADVAGKAAAQIKG